ncbi:cell wall-binding repeat-containing protein [Leifsonia sp. NPDC080035]|uniref:Cell wall-binding repeat-containing protein n=1 Tax=Leifsonia sp. NPDC080035 TaxID=3143936 RepID=A0AAU7G7J0_9MICO
MSASDRDPSGGHAAGSRRTHSRLAVLAIGAIAAVALVPLGEAPPPASAATIAWTQFGNGPSHTGVNDAETQLVPSTVGSLSALFTATLPGVSDGQAVLQPAVATAGGTRDLLFVTTKDGWIVALDAATGASVWSHQNGPGSCRINNGSSTCFTTSSPAIDPSGAWVYSYGLDGKVHKYAIGTGTEVRSGGWPETTTAKPWDEKMSPALTIATVGGHSYLYASNGGYPGDRGDYQGHVTTIDLGTGAQRVFNTLCSNLTVHFAPAPATDCATVQSAVWARPSVVYDAGTNRVLFSTGNATFDGTHNWGDSVLAINPDGTGAGGGPVDSYTPTNQQQLDQQDLDLGSTAPQVVTAPSGSSVPHLAVQSGKDAKIRLLNTANLSGTGHAGALGGELQSIAVPQGGQVLTQPANWVDRATGTSWVLVANGNGIAGLKLQAGTGGKPALVPVWTSATGGTTPIVAGGVLYYLSKSGVRALDPTTGKQLWTDPAGASGLHWQSPIVANGRLYFPDGGGKLRAFALPAGAQTVTRLAGSDRHATSAAVSAASFPPGAPVAYVASGLQFADAVSGSPAAARAGGPMLLVTPTSVPASIQTELTRLHPGRIVVLGGTGAVSDGVLSALRGFTTGTVTRISGTDRYATSAAISRATSATGTVAYIASGDLFPDALSAGALAARTAGAPVLLVTASGIPAVVGTELARLKPASIVVVGGAGAVSDAVLASLKGYTAGTVTRLGGGDRYATSAAVATRFGAGPANAFVASGATFADALSSAAAAGAQGAPLLLTTPTAVPSTIGSALQRLAPRHITLVGGTGSVSDAVQSALAAYVR